MDNSPHWESRGSYWLNTSPQSSPVWHSLRKTTPQQIRVTASNFGTCLGHSIFKTPDELADEMAGIKKPTILPEARRVMDLGTRLEPVARNWYSQHYSVQVREVGLAIPKFDPEIGGSIDGEVVEYTVDKATGKQVEVLDGMIEIKCPEKMYRPLVEYNEKLNSGWKPEGMFPNLDHIWVTHYDQMQGCMAICAKKWADYVVFCQPENSVFVQRIYFNKEHWDKTLYPGIRNFIDHRLRPRLKYPDSYRSQAH